MRNLPAKVPATLLEELTRAYSTPETPATAPVELTIRVKTSGLSVRDFASYLDLIDRSYGRLAVGDLYSYARRRSEHLRLAEVRQGSLELVFSTALHALDAPTVLTLWMLLKYLPDLSRAAGDFAARAGEAYRDYEEGRLVRAQRREMERGRDAPTLAPAAKANLRAAVRADEDLATLTPERRRQLIRLLDVLYASEERELPSATRFAENSVMDVRLRVNDEERVEPQGDGRA